MLRPLGAFLCLLVLFGCLPAISASQYAHHRRNYLHDQRIITEGLDSDGSARETVQEALRALRIANKLRIESPQFNKYEFRRAETKKGDSTSIPLLDYLDPKKNISLAQLNGSESADELKSLRPNPKYGYTLSPELIKAAKEVAESERPTPWDVDYVSIAAKIRVKWSAGNNDTNAMTQKLSRPNGLVEYAAFGQPDGLQRPIEEVNTKREVSSYWMASMEQNGASPYAEEGYKVG